jgi:hypothetical protein
MKNQKGFITVHGLIIAHATGLMVSVVKLGFAACALAAVWHIPAWTAAKANHTEVGYQSQEMFPQQIFDKLPGGSMRTSSIAIKGNGGNFVQGNG